ncbi:ribokinase [Candidatus Bipolaricaulota bacterium]|nr:ribokinase [Candidatus Bipolaricaulota bacterium]
MIAVLGSINMDLVVSVPRFPSPGETLHGSEVGYYCGGKGANQAVAAARLGADVRLFGKVGDDAFGDRLLDGLRSHRVDVDAVECESGCATGLASIWVNDAGENAIVLAAGANDRVDDAYVECRGAAIRAASILLLQLEIPIKTIAHMLLRLPRNKMTVILDPAPACDLSVLPLDRIDILTPNEHELRLISGKESLEEGAFDLLDRGAKHVVCTMGHAGAVWFSSDGTMAHFSAPEVAVVDTTAAGDAFNGALAWALQTRSLEDAIAYGVRAGALATTKRGAQESLPTLHAIEALA